MDIIALRRRRLRGYIYLYMYIHILYIQSEKETLIYRTGLRVVGGVCVHR